MVLVLLHLIGNYSSSASLIFTSIAFKDRNPNFVLVAVCLACRKILKFWYPDY